LQLERMLDSFLELYLPPNGRFMAAQLSKT